MRHFSSLFLILFTSVYPTNIFGQEGTTNGRIIFADGSQIRCSKIRIFLGNNNAYSMSEKSSGDELAVYYNNSWRSLSLTSVKSLQIVDVEYKSNTWGRYISLHTIRLITKTGITTTYNALLSQLRALIYDELSGEHKEQTFMFSQSDKLLIKEVIFD